MDRIMNVTTGLRQVPFRFHFLLGCSVLASYESFFGML